MKIVVVLSFLGSVAAFPQESNQPISMGLKWFNESALGAEFRRGRTLATLQCGNEVIEGLICVHTTAAKCNDLWMQKPQVQNCIADSEVRRLDWAFQRSGLKYHQAMEHCLNGEDPPPDPDEDDFRFKRSAAFDDNSMGSSSSQEAMLCPAESNFEDADGCWRALKEFLTGFRSKFLSCRALDKCTHASSSSPREPGPDRDWFRTMQQMYREKMRKAEPLERKLQECLREEHGWGPQSVPSLELPFVFLGRTGG